MPVPQYLYEGCHVHKLFNTLNDYESQTDA